MMTVIIENSVMTINIYTSEVVLLKMIHCDGTEKDKIA